MYNSKTNITFFNKGDARLKTPELVGMSMTVFIVIFFVGGSFLTVNTNFNWFNPEPLAKGCAEGTFYHSNPPSCQQFPPKIPEGEVLTIKFDHYEGWIELCYENRVCVWTGGLEARQINEMLFEIEESNSRLSTFLLTFLEKTSNWF